MPNSATGTEPRHLAGYVVSCLSVERDAVNETNNQHDGRQFAVSSGSATSADGLSPGAKRSGSGLAVTGLRFEL